MLNVAEVSLSSDLFVEARLEVFGDLQRRGGEGLTFSLILVLSAAAVCHIDSCGRLKGSLGTLGSDWPSLPRQRGSGILIRRRRFKFTKRAKNKVII